MPKRCTDKVVKTREGSEKVCYTSSNTCPGLGRTSRFTCTTNLSGFRAICLVWDSRGRSFISLAVDFPL